VRWPVKEVIIVTKDKEARENILKADPLLKNQANVKAITIVDSLPSVRNKVRSDFKTLGPDFGEKAIQIIAKLAQESADTIINHIEKDKVHEVSVNGQKFRLLRHHLIFERITPDNLVESQFRYGFAYLSKEMDDALEAEGYSRELMRRIQDLRKKSGMQKSDSIICVVRGDEELVEMLKPWEAAVKEKVGASKIKISTEMPARQMQFSAKEKVKGREFEIWIEKV